jgi:hypothetical protein
VQIVALVGADIAAGDDQRSPSHRDADTIQDLPRLVLAESSEGVVENEQFGLLDDAASQRELSLHGRKQQPAGIAGGLIETPAIDIPVQAKLCQRVADDFVCGTMRDKPEQEIVAQGAAGQ